MASKKKGKAPNNETRSANTESDTINRYLSGLDIQSAGVNVNESSALTYSAVLAAVRVYADTLASLPLDVYRRLARGRSRETAHPVYALLHDAPNELMTASTFRETMEAHRQTWGNAYAFIQRDPMTFRPVALYPLMPDRTTPRIINGELVYQTRVNGQLETLSPYEVLHVPYLSFDGVRGYSPIRLMKRGIGIGIATEEFGGKFFEQGANVGGVLKHPGTLSDAALAHLRTSIAQRHTGLANALSLMILEEGMGFERLGIPPEDAQFLETRQFQVSQIASAWRLPPHKIGDLSRSTNNNIEHQGIEFATDSIRPAVIKWEQELKRKLLFASEQAEYYVEFNLDGLLRGDIQSRYSAYATGRQWGWLSINDIRERENMNPIDGGDVYLSPLNMAPAGQPAAIQPPPPPPVVETEPDGAPGPDVPADIIGNGYGLVIRDAVDRIIRREVKAFDRANRRDWWTEHKAEHRDFVAGILAPIFAAYNRLAKRDNGDNLAADYAAAYVEAIQLDAEFEPSKWQARTEAVTKEIITTLKGGE